MKNLKIIGMLLGTAMLATACGGGGSGGGTANFVSPPATPDQPVSVAASEQGINTLNLLNDPTLVRELGEGGYTKTELLTAFEGLSIAGQKAFIADSTATGVGLQTALESLIVFNEYATGGSVTIGSSTITNVGTGDRDFTVYGVDYSVFGESYKGNNIADLKAAHAAGWTGQGNTVITTNGDNSALISIVSPGATQLVLTQTPMGFESHHAAVAKGTIQSVSASTEALIFIGNDAADNAISASGAAVVWHKFDELSSGQLESLINGTRDADENFNLGAALSPVGNLR